MTGICSGRSGMAAAMIVALLCAGIPSGAAADPDLASASEATPSAPPGKPPAAYYDRWPWFWQRWFAEVVSSQKAERLMSEGRIVAAEKDQESSVKKEVYYLITDKGRAYYYSPPDTESLASFVRYSHGHGLPMRTPASSAVIGFLISFISFASIFVGYMCFSTVHKRVTSWFKMRASLKRSRASALMFEDVAGQEGPKAALQDVVAYLRNPDAFKAAGARMPTGILLEGEPGNGKTLLARAVAGEAGVPFFSAAGSEFDEVWAGLGAARIRDMFRMARKHRVSIVFIDEFDAIGSKRRSDDSALANQTINQLLTELDGFNRKNRVFFIGATNLAEKLDPALTRAGRLDRKVFVPHPGLEGRRKILALHSKGVDLAPDADLDGLARSTPGFSGASLAALVNEAAIAAANEGRKTVTRADFDKVTGTVILGTPHGGTVMTEDERRSVAYHEAGHALVGSLVPGADPVRFATILPHGRALGAVVQSPVSDRSLLSRKEYRARLAVSMAGRAAEELVCKDPDEVTGGAKGDIRHATELAREMIGSMGLCPSIGEVDMLSGHEGAPLRAARLDRAVVAELKKAKATARAVISANMEALHALAASFLKHESVSGDDIRVTLTVAAAVMPALRDG